MITIKLSSVPLFKEDEVKFTKKCNLIYGRNGTGKSTLSKIIKNQCSDHNVQVFQGYQSILGDNHHLNAVVLGEHNVEIDKKINVYKSKLDDLSTQASDIHSNIDQPADNQANLWTELQDSKNHFESCRKEVEKYIKNAAGEIKNRQDPTIAKTSYNKNDFEKDIPHALFISQETEQQLIEILHTQEKLAVSISELHIDPDDIITNVNSILHNKVKESIHISRLEGAPSKIQFARIGLTLHKPGDICAFCGNRISDEEYSKVKQYFSSDDIKAFQNEIEDQINSLSELTNKIQHIDPEVDNFYPQFQYRALTISNNLKQSVM